MRPFIAAHEALGTTVRASVERAVSPHVDAWETTAGRLQRAPRLLTIGGGTSEIMREIIAKRLL